MTIDFDKVPVIRWIVVIAVSILFFGLALTAFDVELTREVRMRIYVATSAGLGLVFTHKAIKRLLHNVGHGSEFVYRHSDYRNLCLLFMSFWSVAMFVVAVFLGSINFISVEHATVVVLAFILALASVGLPDVRFTLIDIGGVFSGVALTALAIFMIYSVSESFASKSVELLSLSTSIDLLGPVIAAAVLVGTLQIMTSRTLGPTARKHEKDRHPAMVSVSNDKGEQFLMAVQKLAEIWEKYPAGRPRRMKNDRPAATVEILVNDDLKDEFTLEQETEYWGSGYSLIATELRNGGASSSSVDHPPQYPETVDTEKVLQVKVLTAISDPTLIDQVRLRAETIKHKFGFR